MTTKSRLRLEPSFAILNLSVNCVILSDSYKLGLTPRSLNEFVFGSVSKMSEYACLYLTYSSLLKLIKYPKVTKPP